MATIEIPVDTGFYESFSSPLASQGCINMYPQNPQTKGALNAGALFPTQGIEKFVEVTGVCRGMYVFKELLFSLNGTTLFQIDDNNTFINRGEVTGTGRVSFADNGKTMSIVVPSGDSYFYNSNILLKIIDPVFQSFQAQEGGVTSVSSMDGFFIYTTSAEFFLSSLVTVNEGRNFNALDFSTAESKPDNIVRSMVIRNELLILGTKTIEVFRNIGGSGFPFQRVNGATIDKGLASRFSVIEFDNSYVFLGSSVGASPSIWRGSIGSPSKISTSAIDNKINDFTQSQLLDVFSFIYAEGGNFFIGLTFPDTTFVYDSTSSALQGRPVWHERKTGNTRYRVNAMADAYGDIFVGDDQGGLIGKLDKNTFTDYSQTVSRSFTTAYLSNQGNALFVSEAELRSQSGVGAFRENKQGVDPEVKMEYSDDGGNTFINAGSEKLGKQGEFNKRQVWHRLGRMAYSRVFKFSISEPVKVVFLKLTLKVQGGTDG